MKLLVVARNYEQHLFQFVKYLLEELAKITELSVWHDRGCDVREMLRQLKIEPDFVFIIEYWETNAAKVSGLAELSIPYAVSLHDMHYDIEERKQLLRQEKVTHIFSPARTAFQSFYPEFIDKFIWFPLHANTNIFRDYGLPKDIDYLIMGQADERYYPLRYKIRTTMHDCPGFVYHGHPGYRDIADDEGLYVREKYAQEINRAKIFFTCGGVYNYPVAKYFEALACKALLLAAPIPELADLGFIPGETYVPITADDFREKAEYYLHHEKERLRIAEQGYEMVRERHSTARRAQDLVDEITKILASTK